MRDTRNKESIEAAVIEERQLRYELFCAQVRVTLREIEELTIEVRELRKTFALAGKIIPFPKAKHLG